MKNIKIKYMSPLIGNEIKPPFYATNGSAAFDLSACILEPVMIKKGERVTLPTGIAISLPSNDYVALVYVRSGLGIKHGICLSNGVGVIDSDYRGEIMCGLINLGEKDYEINPGDRIVQVIITPTIHFDFEVVDELEKTERGSKGFGSTGK